MGITPAQFPASGQRAGGEPGRGGWHPLPFWYTMWVSRCGGIGRRAGFRFQWLVRGGSSPLTDICEISSAVERYPSKLDVRSSNLLFRFSRITLLNLFHNSSAVEPPTVNRLVPGSNPGCGVRSNPAVLPRALTSKLPFALELIIQNAVAR